MENKMGNGRISPSNVLSVNRQLVDETRLGDSCPRVLPRKNKMGNKVVNQRISSSNVLSVNYQLIDETRLEDSCPRIVPRKNKMENKMVNGRISSSNVLCINYQFYCSRKHGYRIRNSEFSRLKVKWETKWKMGEYRPATSYASIINLSMKHG